MKRFWICFFVFLVLCGAITTLFPAGASAASGQPLKIEDFTGKPVGDCLSDVGKPNRVDPSPYGFDWYIFNGDYNRFLMLGVDNGSVVAVYCNSKYLLSQDSVKVGTSRESVRDKFGTPKTSLRAGNTVYVFPNTDKKDIFVNDGCYTYYYYDIFDGNKVTSVMTIKQEYIENAMTKPLQMDEKKLAAYANQSVDLVNSIRARRGLKTLGFSSAASKLALFRSEDMRDRNYFSHYTPEGKSPATLAKTMSIPFKSLGENIASGHRDAISAFEAFMNSKGHRENIIDKDYDKMGAGVCFGGNRSLIVTCIMLRDATPGIPSLKAASASYTSNRVSWSKAANASHYELYRATSKNGKYALIKITSSTNYSNTKLKTGQTYYYKVRAYRLENGKKLYGSFGGIVSSKSVPSKVPSVKLKKSGSANIKVSWKKVSGSTRYEVYRATSKNGKYSLVKTVKGTSYTNSKLKKGVTYYYKVRAYHLEGHTKVYGSFSSVAGLKR